MSTSNDRPSLWRPSLFALTWQVSAWGGWGLLAWAAFELNPDAIRAMGAPLAMIVAVLVLSELRPVVMTRLEGNPVSISLAFVFATMYVWGLVPAVVLIAGSVALSEVLQRKPPWKLIFNVGQYVLSLAAAWLVLVAAGATGTPTEPQVGLSAADLGWIVGSWVVYHLVNLALVAGLAGSGDETWWESFTEEFWFYTASVAAVLALSPLIAIVAVANTGSWTLLPLLLLPLLAVQKAAEMSRENERQALHDPLTDLPNRALLSDRVEQALARGARQPGHVAVLFLDLDLFKVVNDSLGHAAGDAVLKATATRLSAVLRPGDTLARFGGDEFVIVCENVPTEEVAGIAERAAFAVGEPLVHEGRQVTVSASIGISISSDESDVETMLRDADAALYRAKATGRSRSVLFDEEMHLLAAARLDSEVGLRRALEMGELLIQYQPIVALDTGAVAGFEALVRWDHPSKGVLAPREFVSVAEETGLILPLGAWVLERAIEQTRHWRSTVPGAQDVWVSVNVSPHQLRSDRLVRALADSLAASGLPAHSVRLEITESALVDAAGPDLAAMNGLRELGVHLAVDDFGTGYSSLAYLTSLPVSTLKIDQSFIAALGGDETAPRSIVDAIVSMSRALQLDVIAEGVETREQLAVLESLDVALGQGFLWSRPMNQEDVPVWLAQHLATDASMLTDH